MRTETVLIYQKWYWVAWQIQPFVVAVMARMRGFEDLADEMGCVASSILSPHHQNTIQPTKQVALSLIGWGTIHGQHKKYLAAFGKN